MSTVTSFRDLLVWQKAMDLAVRTHRNAQRLPRSEQMVLGYQLRKSAVSIPSNVAEGFSRHSTPHYIQHLWTAHASGGELETQLELGRRLDFFSNGAADVLIADAQEVARMINGLVRSLERPTRS
jgi:four helix bundle protein